MFEIQSQRGLGDLVSKIRIHSPGIAAGQLPLDHRIRDPFSGFCAEFIAGRKGGTIRASAYQDSSE